MAPTHKWAVRVFVFSVVLVGVASIAACRGEAGADSSSEHRDPAFFAPAGVADHSPRGDYSYYLNGIVVNPVSQGK